MYVPKYASAGPSPGFVPPQAVYPGMMPPQQQTLQQPPRAYPPPQQPYYPQGYPGETYGIAPVYGMSSGYQQQAPAAPGHPHALQQQQQQQQQQHRGRQPGKQQHHHQQQPPQMLSPPQQMESPHMSPQDLQDQPQQFTSDDQYSASDKFKTELCRKFTLTGYCRYGDMCQFAHGPGQLRALVRHPLYKTSPCKSYESTGSCRYGARCRFIHDERPDQLATVARGVPALNLQVTEPTWEEAQAAAMDAVQHIQQIAVTSAINLSPQLIPSTGVAVSMPATSLRQSSPSSALPQAHLDATTMGMSKMKSPPVSPPPRLAAGVESSIQGPGSASNGSRSSAQAGGAKERSLMGRVRTEPAELSRVLSSPNQGIPHPSSTSVGEIRSISSLIMINQTTSHHGAVSTPSPASAQGRVPRVTSSIRLEEDVFVPPNLDARRLPVANSSSWVNLADMGSSPALHEQSSTSGGRQVRMNPSESLRHSYSQPVLGGDTWTSFSSESNALKHPQSSASIASLPVLPPTNSTHNRSGFSPSTSSPNLQSMYSSSMVATGATGTPSESHNFKKAASYAANIWLEGNNSSTALDSDQMWSTMARAKSVESRLNIFRNLSDQDLAKTALQASKRLPSFDEKLGEVGLTLSDDEDRETEGNDHDTEEEEGFSVGKF